MHYNVLITGSKSKVVLRGCASYSDTDEECEEDYKHDGLSNTEKCYCFYDKCNSGIPFDYLPIVYSVVGVLIFLLIAFAIFFVIKWNNNWDSAQERQIPKENHSWRINWKIGLQHCDARGCEERICIGLKCRKCGKKYHESCTPSAPRQCSNNSTKQCVIL